jgi:hypothetical protein
VTLNTSYGPWFEELRAFSIEDFKLPPEWGTGQRKRDSNSEKNNVGSSVESFNGTSTYGVRVMPIQKGRRGKGLCGHPSRQALRTSSEDRWTDIS